MANLGLLSLFCPQRFRTLSRRLGRYCLIIPDRLGLAFGRLLLGLLGLPNLSMSLWPAPMAAFSLLVDILFERAERKQDMGVSDLTAGIEGCFRLMQRGLAGNLAGSDLFCFRISLVLIIAALLVLIYGCVQLLILENQKKHQAELRQSILGSMLIPANTFLGTGRQQNPGIR